MNAELYLEGKAHTYLLLYHAVCNDGNDSPVDMCTMVGFVIFYTTGHTFLDVAFAQQEQRLRIQYPTRLFISGIVLVANVEVTQFIGGCIGCNDVQVVA